MGYELNNKPSVLGETGSADFWKDRQEEFLCDALFGINDEGSPRL
jgi:hypothetical protein